jgi:hypothetical protein
VWAIGTIAAELWGAPWVAGHNNPPNPHAQSGVLVGRLAANAWARADVPASRNVDAATWARLLCTADRKGDLDLLTPDGHERLLQTMPRQLRAVVARCLTPHPFGRPTIAELEEVTRRILDGDRTVSLGPERTSRNAERLGGRHNNKPVLPYTAAAGVGSRTARDPMTDPSDLRFDAIARRAGNLVAPFDVERTVADATYVSPGVHRTARQRTDLETAMWTAVHAQPVIRPAVAASPAAAYLIDLHRSI